MAQALHKRNCTMLLLAGSIMFSLFFVEFGARIFIALKDVSAEELNFDWDRILYAPHPYIGYALRPRYYREQYRDGELRINSLGFRGPEISEKKPRGVIRIACLGGSTTFSIRVGDKTTYPQLLEDYLKKSYPDFDIEVVNCGVGAYTSAESLSNLIHKVLRLDPDMLIIYHAVNDIHPRVTPGFKSDYTHYRRALSLPSPGIIDSFSSFSRAVALLRTPWLIKNFHIRHMTTLQKFEDISIADQFENFQNTDASAFRDNILVMVDIARSRGIEVVLSTFVYNDLELRDSKTLSYDAYTEGVRQHNSAMREIGRNRGCLLVDVASEFPNQNAQLFSGPVHLLSHGNRIKAEVFHKSIVNAKLIEKIFIMSSAGNIKVF